MTLLEESGRGMKSSHTSFEVLNGTMSEEQESAVPRGIYCPIITFFTNDEKQDLDLDRQTRHVKFLIDAGVHGLVVHGTTGESILLSTEERNTITKLVSKLRDEANKPMPVVVGCSAQSTRETLKMCTDAHVNGGDFALVLPPSYWVKASTPAMLESFYTEARLQSIETEEPLLIAMSGRG